MKTKKINYDGRITADTTLNRNFSSTQVTLRRYSSPEGALLACDGVDESWDENFLVFLIPVEDQTSGTLEVSSQFHRNKARIHFNRYVGEMFVRGYADSGEITFEYNQSLNTLEGTYHFKVRQDDLGEAYGFLDGKFSVHPK
ncbi:hypothetical protein IQK56_21335 [Pseudomonas sp. MAFF 301449]|uniref:Uncharacterized protein n=1 Tax=Pseudomonas cyclaminis TaxID=2781239 RepID=A0ABR9SXR8_9PSED|nr:hypothetical protein [Pseudomonas cyclaminis]MBE8593256.1 hypothetical protein [Pseudomonas cyclaminis]MBE8603565.1 hypothetical protein [Pseudomonas cyclaminis]